MNIGGVKKWLALPNTKPKDVVEEREKDQETTKIEKDNPSSMESTVSKKDNPSSIMESIVSKSLNPNVSSNEAKEYKQ